MPYITNHQRRAWVIPATTEADAITIEAGQSAQVDNARWDALKKGNPVIAALLDQRALVVSRTAQAPVDESELVNPTSPTAPEELKELPEGVEAVDGKHKEREIVEVPVAPGDGPAEGKPTNRRRA